VSRLRASAYPPIRLDKAEIIRLPNLRMGTHAQVLFESLSERAERARLSARAFMIRRGPSEEWRD
jgi:hypothetical protein